MIVKDFYIVNAYSSYTNLSQYYHMLCRVYFDVCRSLIHEEAWWSELTIVVAGYYLKKAITGLCLTHFLNFVS